MELTPKPESKKIAVAHSSAIELTRFQRFIRRMDGAGPRIVLDHLKEDHQVSPGGEVDEELILERQLWLLTGFQMQNRGNVRFAPKSQCNTGRILELYGNLCKLKWCS